MRRIACRRLSRITKHPDFHGMDARYFFGVSRDFYCRRSHFLEDNFWNSLLMRGEHVLVLSITRYQSGFLVIFHDEFQTIEARDDCDE
jgi:hypothetical protein